MIRIAPLALFALLAACDSRQSAPVAPVVQSRASDSASASPSQPATSGQSSAQGAIGYDGGATITVGGQPAVAANGAGGATPAALAAQPGNAGDDAGADVGDDAGDDAGSASDAAAAGQDDAPAPAPVYLAHGLYRMNGGFYMANYSGRYCQFKSHKAWVDAGGGPNKPELQPSAIPPDEVFGGTCQ